MKKKHIKESRKRRLRNSISTIPIYYTQFAQIFKCFKNDLLCSKYLLDGVAWGGIDEETDKDDKKGDECQFDEQPLESLTDDVT